MCAWSSRSRNEYVQSAMVTLPRQEVSYARRDVYLELPKRLHECDPRLTVQRVAEIERGQ